MLMKIFYLTLLSVSISCSKEDGGDASKFRQEYSIEMETKNLKAYDTYSSVDVVAKITKDKKEVTLAEDTNVRLIYSCAISGSEDANNSDESNQVELTISKNSSSGTVTIEDLPVIQFEQINCSIDAEFDIDNVKYSGNSGFDFFEFEENIEKKITPLDVEIKMVNLDIQDEASIADLKFYLLRNGTRIEEGSYAFADEVNLSGNYSCDYGEYGSIFNLTLTKGEGTLLLTDLPGRNDDIVSCTLKVEKGHTHGGNEATQEFDILGGGKLDITVVEAVVGSELKYTVKKNGQTIIRNNLPDSSSLWLHSYCHISFSFLLEEKHRDHLYYHDTIYSTAMKGNYFFHDNVFDVIQNKNLGKGGKGCLLMAKLKEPGLISVGASAFDIADQKIELPFTLNKSNATISASSKYTGKVWAYPYDSTKSSSNLVAYLNANNVTSATKLKASAETNAGNAQLDSSKKYIVFAEVSGVLHVFSM